MPMTPEQEQWRTIQGLLRGYRTVQVLITAAQLGVFRCLAEGPLDADSLATRTGTNVQALARLLNAAVAMQLLTKAGETYANAPLAVTCLAGNGPYHLGNLVAREGAFYQRWSYLPEAVRCGKRPEANIRDEGQGNWVRDFELALYDLARPIGPVVAEMLALPADRPLRALDVGGGHGGYSMALAHRYPNLQAVVFELPAAAEVAREIIAGEGMGERVSVQTGDFQKEGLGSGYDVALLFGVLVSETPAGKLELLCKTHAALVPGGVVVIRGSWFEDGRTNPPEATLFSLHMLLSTEAGDISTQREMESWLIEAGFERPHMLHLPEWIGSSLYVATKPG